MAPIVSPKPHRVTSSARYELSSRSMSTPIFIADHRSLRSASPRIILSRQALLSPIRLTNEGTHKPYLSRLSPPCSPMKKRRSTTIHSSRTSRRRHCSRPDCCITSVGGASFFDRLPWISNMDMPPMRTNAWDIADLSLLPSDPYSADFDRGHVRPQQVLSPSDAVPCDADLIPEDIFQPEDVLSIPPAVDRFPFDPRTPPPREELVPSAVRFHKLMPVLAVYRDDIQKSSETASD